MDEKKAPVGRHEGNVIEWIALGRKSKVLLVTVSKSADIREREDEEEARFLSAAQAVFEKKGAQTAIANADELQSMWDDKMFDLIVLSGVLERQKQTYMSEGKVLSLLRRHLLPDGRVVAIEHNAVGISYLSGAPVKKNSSLSAPVLCETGSGYTRQQLLHLFAEAGYEAVRVLYPYDNEYHTRFIFSDEWQPNGKETYLVNHTAHRLRLFDEEMFCRTVVEENVFAPFANAFVVEAYAHAPAKQPPRLLFAKYSDDRKNAYAIRTAIYAYPSGERAVTKTPLGDEARGYVSGMQKTFEALSAYYKGYSLQIAPCVKMEDGVGFSYIKGQKLSDLLDGCLASGDLERAGGLMQRFVDVATSPAKLLSLDRKKSQIKFGANADFTRVFGRLMDYEEDLLREEEYLAYTDIDLNFDSVIVEGNTWTVYDYEWCMDFPVPFSYIIWHAVSQYFLGIEKRRLKDYTQDFLLRFGINEQKQAVFARMERMFYRYIGRTDGAGDSVAAEEGYALDDLLKLLPDGGRAPGVPVRITYTDGETERKLLTPKKIADAGKEYEVLHIGLSSDAARIRISLSDGGGILSEVDVRDESGTSLHKQLAASATRSTGGKTYFFSPDAYLELTPKKKVRGVDVRYIWTPLPAEALAPLKELTEGGNSNGKRNRRFFS